MLSLWEPLAGIALFLFAMRQIELALEQLSGRSFRRFVRRNTDNPVQGVISGTVVTAILQSSSLVGLMMLALVGAGVMQMRNALSVIFGANLGTTFTGWIVATIGFRLDLDALSLPLIGVAGIAYVMQPRGPVHESARFGFSLGLLLMGLEFMKGAVSDVDSFIDPATLAAYGPFEFLIFGVAFSAIVQSSSATMAVTLSALYGGVIDLPSAAAVAIGADLGTTSTVLVGAFKGSAAKKRVAAGHFGFNFVTDMLAFVLRMPLLGLIALAGITEPVYALVAFHSLFNLIGLILFLPLIGKVATFLERRFTDTVQRASRHLGANDAALPEPAVEAIELETAHLLQRVIRQNLLVTDPPIRIAKGRIPVGEISREYASVPEDVDYGTEYQLSKQLEGEILAFAVDLQSAPLEADQSTRIDQCQRAVREAVHSAKSLKDIVADLQDFDAGVHPALTAYGQRFRDVLTEFYLSLFAIRKTDEATLLLEDLIELMRLVHRGHDDMHSTIYADIRHNQLDEGDISSLLNVNREVFYSCRSLLTAIAAFAFPPESLEIIESLPGKTL